MASVSVALCTFDGGRFLDEQLDSIVSQTAPPEEIVVSDDGSRDGTRELVERFARRSPVPMRLLPPGPRRGVAGNFERAIAATSGELVALCDQDDIWHPTHLERLADVFATGPSVLLVHSDARLVDAGGAVIGPTLLEALRAGRRELELVAAGDAFEVLIRRNLVTGATAMIRRSLFDYAAPVPPGWIHDEWLAMTACARGVVWLVDVPLTDYRQHGANEIGARALSVGELMRRLVEPAGERLALLSTKWATLSERAESLGFDESRRLRIAGKAVFERERAADPQSRLRRAPRILRRLVGGDYTRFASQGRRDAVRDLLSRRETSSRR